MRTLRFNRKYGFVSILALGCMAVLMSLALMHSDHLRSVGKHAVGDMHARSRALCLTNAIVTATVKTEAEGSFSLEEISCAYSSKHHQHERLLVTTTTIRFINRPEWPPVVASEISGPFGRIRLRGEKE